MRVLTQWVLDSYPIVYIDKTIKQHPLACTVRWIRFYCCVPFGHWQSEPNRVFSSVSKYITDCYFITYSTNNSFVYLVGYLRFQLLEKNYPVLTRAKRPRSDLSPFMMVFRTKLTGSPWTRCSLLTCLNVQNPIKRRSDAVRVFARSNRQYSLYWNQIHKPFHGWRIRLIDFTYWFVLN